MAVATVILIGAAAVQLTGDLRAMAVGVFVVGVPVAGFYIWRELRENRLAQGAERQDERSGGGDDTRIAA